LLLGKELGSMYKFCFLFSCQNLQSSLGRLVTGVGSGVVGSVGSLVGSPVGGTGGLVSGVTGGVVGVVGVLVGVVVELVQVREGVVGRGLRLLLTRVSRSRVVLSLRMGVARGVVGMASGGLVNLSLSLGDGIVKLHLSLVAENLSRFQSLMTLDHGDVDVTLESVGQGVGTGGTSRGNVGVVVVHDEEEYVKVGC